MSILHTYIPSRVIDDNGIADGATLTFYLSGTNTLTPVYADAALTTPLTNPVVVPSGAEVPTIYLDEAIDYRRVVTYSDGSTEDIDPYEEPFGQEARIVRSDLASTDSGKGAALVAYKAPGTGSADLDVSEKLAEVASVKDKGAKGDGATNDNAAMLLAEAGASSVYWPEGTYIVDQVPDITKSWGPGVVIVGGNRVYLRPTADQAASIKAEVFGLPVFDDASPVSASAPLQRAFDFAQSLDLPVELPANWSGYLGTGLTLKQGQAVTGDTTNYRPEIICHKNFLYPGPGVTALTIVPQRLTADKAGNPAIDDIRITGGLVFRGNMGNGSSRGLVVGATDYWIYPNNRSLLSDILFEYFALDATAVRFVECSHFHLERFTVRSGVVIWSATAPGSFGGDFNIDDSQFTGTAGRGSFLIDASNSVSGSGATLCELRGFRFKNCTIYGANAKVVARNKASVGDIWFNGVQYDAPPFAAAGEIPLEIEAVSTNASVFNIQFVGKAYMVGYTGPAIYAHTESGGHINAIGGSLYLNGFNLATATTGSGSFNSLFLMVNVESFTLTDGVWTEISGDGATSLVNMSGGLSAKISGNFSRGNDAVQYGLTVGTGANNYEFTNNTLNVTTLVNDYSSGTPNRVTTPNFKI